MNIVILPGLDGTGLLALRVHKALESDHSVTTLAYPHHLCRYKDIVEWIKPQLPDENFILVAESFSGPIAVLIGTERPPELTGIVFVATFARSPIKLPIFFTYLIEIMPIHASLMSRLVQPFLMGKWADRAFTNQFRQALLGVPTSTLRMRLSEVLSVNVVDALRKIEVPILYLRATKDWLIPAKMSLDFATLPGRVESLEGPHFLLQAKADQAAAHIAHFAIGLD